MNSTNGCVNGYMTEKEAAKYLGLSPATLKTSRSKGVLIGAKPPTYYTFGRSVRYRKEDLDDWSSRVYKKVEGGVCESEKAESLKRLRREYLASKQEEFTRKAAVSERLKEAAYLEEIARINSDYEE